MRRFLNAITAFALLALGATSALAQTQNVQPIRRATYSMVASGITPAASATDFVTLTGSATKTVWVHEAGCSGTSTAAATHVIVALKRSTANSAGTSAALTEVPHDSLSSAATATGLSYSANPTTGTLVGNIGAQMLSTVEAAANVANSSVVKFEFGADGWTQPVVLRGATQVFALNGAGASFAAGTALTCWVTWSE